MMTAASSQEEALLSASGKGEKNKLHKHLYSALHKESFCKEFWFGWA